MKPDAVRRIHRMPFGAEPDAGGGTRFRLWAPDAGAVEVVLSGSDGPERTVPLTPVEDGWYECNVPTAVPGDRYRFRIDGKQEVPDPASRFQPEGVHGPSRVESPTDFAWTDGNWAGRPFEETVLYEVHVGTFSGEGTFAGVRSRLDHLAGLGVNALELMPIAAFPGKRNWGYDGVLPYSPAAAYGAPEDLKRLVQEAHARGISVFLDVVYNHFGPEGNYLHLYASSFFDETHQTPWGAGLNFNGPRSETVREYFIHNALYWLEEFHLDGLRLDAVHAIPDPERAGFLHQLARRVAEGPGARRPVHLVLENNRNQASLLRPPGDGPGTSADAQWNDDFHHAAHVLLTGERGGYYIDFADDPARCLRRCLREGFAWQGEPSRFHDDRPRGEPSGLLPPSRFVNFLQNHDQIGNRAFGERLVSLAPESRLRFSEAVLLLAPFPPLLFMGEEWGARSPFLFFCDFGPDLAPQVAEGRRREFARFEAFSDPATRERIPDPNDPATFQRSVLDWSEADRSPHRDTLDRHRRLLDLRKRELLPRLIGAPGGSAEEMDLDGGAFRVTWRLGDGSRLTLLANPDESPVSDVPPVAGRCLLAEPSGADSRIRIGRLPPWSAAWYLEPAPVSGGSEPDSR